MSPRTPSIVSRLIMLCVAGASVAVALWFGSQALEPVPVPPPPPIKSKVTFQPRSDVSTNPVFRQLEPLAPSTIDIGARGRTNPFVPLPVSGSATSTASSTPLLP